MEQNISKLTHNDPESYDRIPVPSKNPPCRILARISPRTLLRYDNTDRKVRQQSNHVAKIVRSQFGRKYDAYSVGNM